mgnify:CR=1 FL=1
MLKKHLIIFAKNPRIGRVKTRLARDMGKVGAWGFYRQMLSRIPARLAKKGPWETYLSYSPDHSLTKIFPAKKCGFLKQGAGDLGDRMFRPKDRLKPGPFVIIGTDIPDIKPSHIKKAFKLLGKNDVVFGPCDDGGFWLVGLKRHPIITDPYQQSVRWSHEETLNDCLKNLKSKKVAFLESLEDIDTFDDLKRWRENR